VVTTICIPPLPTEFEALRHSSWARERDEHLGEYPACVCCAQMAETVHHVVPVGRDPSLEMVRTNWASVCHFCHFAIGHACNWRKYVPNFWLVARAIKIERIGDKL
jgi:hypothetical protein